MPLPKECERCGIRMVERGKYQRFCRPCQLVKLRSALKNIDKTMDWKDKYFLSLSS